MKPLLIGLTVLCGKMICHFLIRIFAWFDTANSVFGIFEWNGAAVTSTGGQAFGVKAPTVITDAAKLSGGVPKGSVGAIGDYAIVAGQTTSYAIYKKNYFTKV